MDTGILGRREGWATALSYAGGAKVPIIMTPATVARAISAKAGLETHRNLSSFVSLGDPASVWRRLPRLLSRAAPDCPTTLCPDNDADADDAPDIHLAAVPSKPKTTLKVR